MDVLNSLLDFIYFGQVEIRGDQLDKFMALANELKVKGLSKDENLANGKNYEENKKAPFDAFDREEESRIIERKECKSDEEAKEDAIHASGDAVWENDGERMGGGRSVWTQVVWQCGSEEDVHRRGAHA